MFLNDIVVPMSVEEAKATKQRLDPKCWKGKHKEGTKVKGGVRVNNCVPNESVEEAFAPPTRTRPGAIGMPGTSTLPPPNDAQIKKMIWDALKIDAPTGQEALEKAIADLTKRPQTPMVQNLLGKISMIARRMTVAPEYRALLDKFTESIDEDTWSSENTPWGNQDPFHGTGDQWANEGIVGGNMGPRTEADVKKIIWNTFRIEKPTAKEALEAAITLLAEKPKTRTVQQMLGHLSALVAKSRIQIDPMLGNILNNYSESQLNEYPIQGASPADSESPIHGGMEESKLSVGDPVIVTAPNEFEGKTGEIAEFSPSGKFVIVNLYNYGEHSMHLSDVGYNQHADEEDEMDEGYATSVGINPAALDPISRWKIKFRQLLSDYAKNPQGLHILAKQNGTNSLEAMAYRYLLNPTGKIPLPPNQPGATATAPTQPAMAPANQPGVAESFGDNPVTGAITRRILQQRHDLLKQYGPELVGAAVDNVADYVGDVEEIGSSDVSGWVAQVERMLKENPPEAFRESEINEFAPSPERDDNDDVPDQILKLANRWWNATDDQPKITNVLRSLGWSIHQVESEDDAVQMQHDDGTTYFISADDFDPDVFEGEVTPTATGLKHRATKGYGADYDAGRGQEFGKQKDAMDLTNVNKTLTKSLEKGMDVDFKEGWSDAMVARRTGQPRTPYSVYIKGKKWKDFENDDHAEAVANKLRAKFKADRRDPSVITIAPTDMSEGVATSADQAKRVFKDKAGQPVGEIGIDPESSPGNGEWYVHHYATGYSVVGFDSAAEAKRELLYVHKHPDAVEGHPSTKEQGVAEAEDRVDPILIKALNRMPDGLNSHGEVLNACYDAYAMELGRMEMKSNYGTTHAYVPQLMDLYKQKHGLTFNEAANPAQQAAIAIAKKKEQGVDEDTGSWIVYDPNTKQIKKRFKTHTAGKSYAQTHGLGFASSEYYFDTVKEKSVTEAQTDYQKRRQRERDIDAGKPVTRQPKNPQTDYARKRAKDRKEMELGESYWTRLQNERNTKVAKMVNELSESIQDI